MKPSGNTYSASIPTTTTISSLPPISSMGAGKCFSNYDLVSISYFGSFIFFTSSSQ